MTTYSKELLNLKAAVDNNPEDLMAKLTLAVTLQQEEYFEDAVSVYEQIRAQDTEGVLKATAQKAIEEIEEKLGTKVTKKESFKPHFAGVSQRYPSTVIHRIYNLPISWKQFLALLTSSMISVTAVVGAGMAIAIISGRSQLKNQAAAELEVTTINYNAKSAQMESGFRALANNPDFALALQQYQQGKIAPLLQAKVVQNLREETKTHLMEYAMLLNTQGKIVASANRNRTGEIFNPNNLVGEVLRTGNAIQRKTILEEEEITKEITSATGMRRNASENSFLVNFNLTPIESANSDQVVGLLISGEVLNDKTTALEKTIEVLGNGYAGIYIWKKNKFQLVSSVLKIGTRQQGSALEMQKGVGLQDLSLLEKAKAGVAGDNITRIPINNQWYTVAVKALEDSQGDRVVFIVRGTPESSLNDLVFQSFLFQIAVAVVTVTVGAVFAFILGRNLIKPIQRLRESAQKIGSGAEGVRAEVLSNDEVGQLAQTFNEMAERIEVYTKEIQAQSDQRKLEAEYQKHEKEELQNGVIELLLGIEEAAKGDLTVTAKVDKGEVGAIADAFNTTLRSLQKLVKQVLEATEQVNNSAQENSKAVAKLSDTAIPQYQALQNATKQIEAIATDLQIVSKNALEASIVAHQGNEVAQQGQERMDETVSSIYKIRSSVADTSKKAKRLAESSQEISKIVSIIADISEKTNLLAYNATIEATKAGENGQGFRIVADEVRRLAEQVSESAQEIEQLIVGVQEETAEMTKMMEESTTEVVIGTKLVQNTKETLQRLAEFSTEIHQLLNSISSSTETQTSASLSIKQTMQEIAVVASHTAKESQQVSQSLQELVEIALELQKSASSFKIESQE